MTPKSTLAQAFLAGAADLGRRAPLLDRINVFPVVDADTGVNMSQTLSLAVDYLENNQAVDISELSRCLSPLLLKSARGNSGVIFSQFLVGVFDSLCVTGQLTYGSFSAAVAHGRNLAYEAVATPEEGTILTTMTALSNILSRLESVDSLDDHSQIEHHLAQTVARTPSLLPRLKQAGVVDSGALGFHIFASGLCLVLPALNTRNPALAKIEARCLGKDEVILGDITESILPEFLASASTDDSMYRYCINMLIERPEDLKQDWAAPFAKLGSSHDTAKSGNLIKLHLHSNEPKAVRLAGEQLGRMLDYSAEDMTSALVRPVDDLSRSEQNRMPLRIISDSSMSLDFDIAHDFGIYRIENYVSVHNRMVRDSDLDRDELFLRMRSGHVYTTAQTSQDEVQDFLDRMLKITDHLVYVAVGNAYTGTQNLVRLVVNSHPKQNQISILDTHAASGQQGLICLAAARYAETAKDLQDLTSYINNQIATCCEYLVIDNLKYLSRTGRIGKIKAAMAGVLSVKPIVGHGHDGAVTHTKVRHHKAATHEIIDRIKQHPGTGKLLIMLEHTDNRDWTNEVANQLKQALPKDTEFINSPLSSTSSVHMGPGTWGVTVTRI